MHWNDFFFEKVSNINVAENIIQHFPLIIRIPQKGGCICCRRGLLYCSAKILIVGGC